MLRVRFEKFISYLQGSLNFSNFMRSEISKFGVGQAAIDMSFQTSVQFPNVFVLDRIVGEIPLDVYTLTVADILNDNELADKSILRDYSFEKIDLNSRFVQMNLASDTITKLFAALDSKNRIVDMRTRADLPQRKCKQGDHTDIHEEHRPPGYNNKQGSYNKIGGISWHRHSR
jgi:hypothetical protein